MKKLETPRGLRWTKDRVQSFRARQRIKQSHKTDDSDVMTGQQARDYLGIGYHGLVALVRRGVIHKNQVTDFAPWRIPRAELDSEPVRALDIFDHPTGSITLYYDIELRSPLAEHQASGRMIPSTTLILKNRLFVPVPEELVDESRITEGAKQFYVNFDTIP